MTKLAVPVGLLAVLVVTSSAIGQESSRADFQEYCQAMHGRWVGEVTWVANWPGLGKKGDKVTGYAEIKLAADGNALLGTFYGGNGVGHWISVYDSGSKQIKELVSSSGGTVWNNLIRKEGGKWVSISTGSNPDGSKLKSRSTLTVSNGGDTHTWVGSGTIGVEKTADQHDVWRRVSK